MIHVSVELCFIKRTWILASLQSRCIHKADWRRGIGGRTCLSLL